MEIAERKQYLADKLREAVASENKVHVIFRDRHWVIISEAAKRAVGLYRFKPDAYKKAQSLLDNRKTEAIIFHKKDGSVDKVQYAENKELQHEPTTT